MIITTTQVDHDDPTAWVSRRVWWKPWTWLRSPRYVGRIGQTITYCGTGSV